MSTKWPRARLGDVLRHVERFEPRDEIEEYPFAGTYSFARGIFVGERKLGSTFALPKIQRIRAGDFVYCKIMAWEGAFGLVPKEADGCVMSGAFVVYELNRDRIEPKFLDYFFKVPAYWQIIGSQSSGTNVRRQSLHPTQFEKAEIPLPSLPEQKRIVARIEEVAAQIEVAKALRKQAVEEVETLIKSHVTRMIRQKVDSKSWKVATLPELAARSSYAIKRGPFGSHLRKEFFVQSGYKVYEQKHAIYGDFSAGSYYIDANKFNEMSAFEVKPGDLIISCSGTIGKVAIVPENAEPGIINQALLKVTLDTTKVDRQFFKLVFESDYISAGVTEISPGSAMKNIGSVKTLKGIPFPLPPITEQKRIMADIDVLQTALDKLKRLQAETAVELDALLPSILDKAFKGEL